MQRTFTPDLRDESSPAFVTLAVVVTESLTAVYIAIPGFIRIIILGFVPGSVRARYVAEFAAEEAASDSEIQRQAQNNLAEAVKNGTFNGTLNVTDSQALEPTSLTPEELAKVTSNSNFCTLRCGEGGVCQLTEKFPGVLISECVCVPHYCAAGTCDVIVDQGPRCTCPASMFSWYRGERCDHVLTQGHIIGIALGCASAGLVGLIIVAVCLAKREKNSLKKKKEERYRYEPPVILENYNPQVRLPMPRAALGRDDYPPTGSELDLLQAKSPLYTDSIRDRGRPRWTPVIPDLPPGQFKIPRPAFDKVYPKDDAHSQSFEINFSNTGGEETRM
ncbi:CSPG5 [Branchiostoma lanceolatum]|uniref:CSPG5 protein n=1 Tax=Branchiostoma lanceolatum TaxID=7740 RepID=A0A8J9VX55_BRALA|nr:CSPG5 [Branchiostoma lanceolatum]